MFFIHKRENLKSEPKYFIYEALKHNRKYTIKSEIELSEENLNTVVSAASKSMKSPEYIRKDTIVFEIMKSLYFDGITGVTVQDDSNWTEITLTLSAK